VTVITLKGRVFTGGGEGTTYTSLSWVRKQFQEKLGFQTYPGTLNIRLSEANKEIRLLRNSRGVEIEPPDGFYRGRCFKALIMGQINGAIVVPDVSKYSSDVLEIVAPVNLRRKFDLIDGDEIVLDALLE